MQIKKLIFCPLSNFKVQYCNSKLTTFLKTPQRLNQNYIRKVQLGPGKHAGDKNLVWFGEIERKLAKLSITNAYFYFLFFLLIILILRTKSRCTCTESHKSSCPVWPRPAKNLWTQNSTWAD
jgi:hypothetical protein